jgi:hypothetical protein
MRKKAKSLVENDSAFLNDYWKVSYSCVFYCFGGCRNDLCDLDGLLKSYIFLNKLSITLTSL